MGLISKYGMKICVEVIYEGTSLEIVLEKTEIIRQEIALKLTPVLLPRKPRTGEIN